MNLDYAQQYAKFHPDDAGHRRGLTLLHQRVLSPHLPADRSAPILDVGCGEGILLRQFVEWGATPASLAGVDLRPDAMERASQLAPGTDLRCCSATELPWPDETFALVCQHTMFTSILDERMRRQAAAEMARVLRPGGAILWYDFAYDNPSNRDVRRVTRNEIYALFPQLEIHLQRITLAPPIVRRFPAALLPILHPLLGTVPFLRTHFLGLFLKPRR